MASSVYSAFTVPAVSFEFAVRLAKRGSGSIGLASWRSVKSRRAVWRRQKRSLNSSRPSAALLSLVRLGDCGSGMSL